MKIESSIFNKTLEIKLDGRLDTSTSPELEQYLSSNLTDNVIDVIFDFENLLYISSAGLRLLLMTQKNITAVNGKVTVRNVNSFVMDILDSVGFSDILVIE